jgi:phosphomannomutase
MNLLFDIDGTLTEPVQPIGDALRDKLLALTQRHNVYLVAGSTHAKVESQLDSDFMGKLAGCFTSSGAEYHQAGELIYSLPKPNLDLYPDLKRIVEKYTAMWNGTHTKTQIEVRPGMLNLCPIGREATATLRSGFVEWDVLCQFRQKFAAELASTRARVLPVIGGQVSVDLYFEGFTGKDYAVKFLSASPEPGKFIYFGDKMTAQGNDYPAATHILAHNLGAAVAVTSPEDTLNYLNSLGF